MKNTNPLEKEIESKVCAYAKSLGVLTYKFTSPARRSVPDRLFISKTGKVFWIEFKRLGCVPTPAQQVEIDKLKAQQAEVYVVNQVEHGKNVVDCWA